MFYRSVKIILNMKKTKVYTHKSVRLFDLCAANNDAFWNVYKCKCVERAKLEIMYVDII